MTATIGIVINRPGELQTKQVARTTLRVAMTTFVSAKPEKLRAATTDRIRENDNGGFFQQ